MENFVFFMLFVADPWRPEELNFVSFVAYEDFRIDIYEDCRR